MSWLRKTKTLGMPELDQIAQILFPDLELHKIDGKEVYIDYSAEANLEAALIDINDGTIDSATKNSMMLAIQKLQKVRKILDRYPKLKRRVKYYVVGNDGVHEPQVEAKPLDNMDEV